MSKLIGLLLAAFIVRGMSVAGENGGIIGIWTVPDGKARIEISAAQDGLLEGRIQWLQDPTYDSTDAEAGRAMHDRNNPDPARRGDGILGLAILQGFHEVEQNSWKGGTIYDPESGKTYSCKLKLAENGRLEVRGFIGISLLGRTEEWTRYRESD